MQINKMFYTIILAAICLQAYTQNVCPKNCMSPCTNATTCITCNPGYYLDSTTAQCRPCNTGCKQCGANGICNKCLDNYNWDQVSNVCYFCDLNCKTCYATATNYSSCQEGLTLTSSNNQTRECTRDPNCKNILCKTCQTNSTNLC